MVYMNKKCRENQEQYYSRQCLGSILFWCGSRSWICHKKNPDPDPGPMPSTFLKIHWFFNIWKGTHLFSLNFMLNLMLQLRFVLWEYFSQCFRWFINPRIHIFLRILIQGAKRFRILSTDFSQTRPCTRTIYIIKLFAPIYKYGLSIWGCKSVFLIE